MYLNRNVDKNKKMLNKSQNSSKKQKKKFSLFIQISWFLNNLTNVLMTLGKESDVLHIGD